ncbi:hypothetical protein HUU59_10900 [bacterium]|nr:hypothetical protein [bacterium]
MSPDDHRAISVYFEALRYSGRDELRLPKIDKLEHVLLLREYRMNGEELQNLLDRVYMIHEMNYQHQFEQLNRG